MFGIAPSLHVGRGNELAVLVIDFEEFDLRLHIVCVVCKAEQVRELFAKFVDACIWATGLLVSIFVSPNGEGGVFKGRFNFGRTQ